MMLRIVLVAGFLAAASFNELVDAEPGSDFMFRNDDYDDELTVNDQRYKQESYSHKSSHESSNRFHSRIGGIDFDGGCTSAPNYVINGNLSCHSSEYVRLEEKSFVLPGPNDVSAYRGCRASCLPDHRFPNGETELAIVCRDGAWRVQGADYDASIPHCEPVCLPECKNTGICIRPNQCNCPDNFSGPQCQFENKPCLNAPPTVKNAEMAFNTKTSTITCHKDFTFPGGSTIANMICRHGNWEPTRTDWVSVPDCQPKCHPPCQNGAVCLSLNVCQCPQDFVGAQCQYSADVCSSTNLNFNGGTECATLDDFSVGCHLTCPPEVPFEYAPAAQYVCRYDVGRFEPRRVPQCVPPAGASIFSLGSIEKRTHVTRTLNTSWRIESGGAAFGDASSTAFAHGDGLFVDVAGVEGGGPGVVGLARPEGGACFTWGGAHYKTFDGRVLSFAGSDCAYTLLKDARDGLFTVVAQSDPLCRGGAPGCPRMLRLLVQGRQYELAANAATGSPELRSGGRVLAVPSQLPSLRLEAESGRFLAVTLDALGLKVKWDGARLAQIEASESLWNRTAGLCGSLDGRRHADRGPGAKDPLRAAAAWRIDDIAERCEEPPSAQDPCAAGSARLGREADEFCARLLSDSRYRSCAGLVDVAGFHAACRWDYCSCADAGPSSCACDTMGVYVRQCAHRGLVALAGWRDSSVCPMRCDGGREYAACGPAAEPTCAADSSARLAAVDSNGCEEGCFCPAGTVLHEGRCVAPAECPCRLRGRSFAAGATVPKDCNTCVCAAGRWTCTETKCGARCSAIGDPHYTTFDGKRYDFMGECSYYLVKGHDYSVQAENAPCSSSISEMMGLARGYRDGDPSCTKTVTIRANDVAVKLKQNRQISVNGEDVTKLPLLAGEIRVRIVSSIFVAVELPNGLQVLWDGVSRVYINAPPQFRGQTKGLCGTFSASQKDDFLTPDGDVEQAVVAFANKWKTDEHCADIKKDSDHPCDVNAHKRDAAEKYCGVLKTKIFLGCHWHVDPEPFYKDCLYDMCACEDSIERCLCPTLAAYAKDCVHLGVIVPWRQQVHECRIHCPGDQEYQACGSSCTRSCADISFHGECKEECVEGCNCPKGSTLDVNGNCIPINHCPCTYGGLEFLAGYKEVRPATKGQQLCTCASGRWSCQPATPDEISDYPAMTQLKSLCSATKHQKVTTCEPVEQRTCGNMHRHTSQTPAICRPGCVCKAGYVLDAPSGECVPENRCPCYHGGRSYKEGTVRQKECNSCKCTQGKWNCTDIRCPGVCSVWGDSHYKSFDDKLFDFQGACEYVLAKGRLNDDEAFDVTVRNVPCGTTGVTCSKSVTLTVGKNDHALEERVTLTRGKSMSVDDFKDLQRVAVRRAGLFVFLDVPDLGLVVQWDEGTRAYVRLDARWKSRTKGLCGDFNDDAEDDFKTPSGGLSEASASLFGDSWKLSELCAEPSENPPDTCAQRPERQLWAVQQCRIMKSAVFEACHSEVPPEQYIERCIYDTCGCDEGGDCQCLCTAIAAYAQQCNAMGVPVHWRSQQLCPMQCDETCSKYSSCVTTCPRETCDNLVTLVDSLHLCDQDTCVEGCKPKSCPEGQVYLNSSYAECVPRTDCKPVCTIINGTIYYEGDKVKGDDCHSCFCSRGKVLCKGLPCQVPFSTPLSYTQVGGTEEEKCRSGWTTWLNRDRPKDDRFRNEIEEMPSTVELLNVNATTAVCDRTQMIDIRCRKVNTALSHKEVGLNVDCGIDTGFVCRLSDNRGENCPDFEISVLCDCGDDPPPMTAPPAIDPCVLNTYQSSPLNCFDFFHCGIGPSGSNEWIPKTCAPDMMFNDRIDICDWPANVEVVRPECLGVHFAETPESRCNPGEHWDDCAIRCSQTCHGYNHLLTTTEVCNRTIDCLPGCVSNSRTDCTAKDNYWLNENTCVHSSDCTCISENGQIVPPGRKVQENDCKTCQCLNNHYTCDESLCNRRNVSESITVRKPKIYEFRDVVIVPHVSSPPRDCLGENYAWLTEQSPFDVNFSASSYLSTFVSSDMIRLQRTTTPFVWRPSVDDQQPWLEIELVKPQPIYGIVVGGDPFADIFVTSYYVLFSDDGYAFSVVGNWTTPDELRGPAESNAPVQQFFHPPIEAKFVRVYPAKWHGAIAMQVELIACAEERTTSTIAPPIVVTPSVVRPVCDDPMGYDSGLMDRHQVMVASSYDGKEPNLRLSNPDTWHPFLDNPNQYVQFDFLEPRNLTGVETKGGDDTWVTQYTVKYSQDGLGWSPILDKFGADRKFLANVDDYSSRVNYFDLPISARLLRIHPYSWHNHVGMRVEIRGCFLPYPPIVGPSSAAPPPANCDVCPGIETEGQCLCGESLWWNGQSCVAMQDCPCVVNGISYSVGSSYETADCQICTCAMSGFPMCNPKVCPACSIPEQRPVVGELCACLCKNCPAGQRLCRTNDLCIDADKWCNGVKDCPDDEPDDCEYEFSSDATITNTTITKIQCVTTCPPGFVTVDNIVDGVNLANFSITMSQNQTYEQSTFVKVKLPPPRFDSRFADVEEEEPHICPKIICKREMEVATCEKLECPAGYQPTYDPAKSIRKTLACDNTCIPIPPKMRVCTMIGRSFSTFDGLDYKYDVCNHILARDMDFNKWYIVVEKVCQDQTLLCQKILTVSFDEHVVILEPNMYVTIDGQRYNPSEVKRLGDKNPAMKISRVGNALRFETPRYPFWTLLDASGTIKIGVSEQLVDRVDGMCGYLDGIMVNDQQTPSHELAKSAHEFGDSWKVLDSAECRLQVCPREVQQETWRVCTMARDPAFDACSSAHDREKFVASCLESHCACMTGGNLTAQQCRCDALAAYVSTCLAADSSVDLTNWRSVYDCPAVCDAPFVPKDCFRRKCELSCENLLESDPCPSVDDVCVQGCFCPDGMVRHGDTCVPPAECRDCVCDGLGNSRFVTFDRSNVLFNANCTYMLSRDVADAFDGKHKYQILVTNGACDEGICTEVITTFYDGHIVQIRKNSDRGQLIAYVDDQQIAYYPFDATWLVIGLTPSGDVQLLMPEIQMEIVAFKRNLAFVLRLPSHTFGGAMEGLCGNCNGRQHDDLKMHDGQLTNDQQEFGNSWAAKNLPDSLNLNVDAEQCSSRTPKSCAEQPSMNGFCEQLLLDVAFARCHGMVNPSPYYLACKDTLCQGGNACANFEAYARMCTMNGACIAWRTPQLCPYECADNLEYQACGTGCAKTCKTIESSVACRADPVEGCFCPEDFVWQNGTCIPTRNCFACDEEGHVDGDTWQPDKCTHCTCKQRLISCSHAECPAIETVCNEHSDAVIVPGTETDCCPKYLCVPRPTEAPACMEMQQPQCGYAQTLKVTVDANGCQKFICQCVPKDQCSLYDNDVGSNSDVLEPGYAMTTDISGCCPKTTKVCKPETCPPVPICQKYYKVVTVDNPNACCPRIICEPPKDLCLYYMDSSNDLEFNENLVAKQIGDVWLDGLCKTCTCDFNDGVPTSKCVTKDCIKLENHPDANDYVLKSNALESQCCSSFERIACKDDNRVYQVGEKWYPLLDDSCVTTECLLDSNGLRKKTFTKVCTDICELGYKYQESQDRGVSCCGECKPYACVVDGILKDVGDVWYSDDYCVKSTCEKKNGSLHVKSVSETCETINPMDKINYQIEMVPVPGKCCPKLTRIACLADGLVYEAGSSWNNSLDSCVLESCVETPDGQIVKNKESKTCNTACPKGWKYQKSADPKACCGECEQVYCIVDDYLYEPGQTWYSSDNCTTYSCAEKSDQLLITTSSPVCPKIDCAPEMIIHDGCCQKCEYRAEPQQQCVAEVFDFSETIGLIAEKKGHHGVCKNMEPIKGLAECYGHCDSSTRYDTKTWDQVIDCSCCQPLDYKKINVQLTCEDGITFKRVLTVPTICSCEACTGKKHPKHHGLKQMLQKYKEERKMKNS
ncbi:hemocytin [Phymastichus coffea]|uniref:hemocytin n=1 Tax=Phymastichus coffea TaxID=108790 RepID=UPI00273AF8E6|nr:hemocytin [Phymastichus coffea]